MQSRPKLLLGGVRERDVDLLLLEEFYSSDQFWQWFTHTAIKNIPEPLRLLEVRR
jgi:hypothetical protein